MFLLILHHSNYNIIDYIPSAVHYIPVPYFIYLFIIIFLIFFLTSLLAYNCFTMVC